MVLCTAPFAVLAHAAAPALLSHSRGSGASSRRQPQTEPNPKALPAALCSALPTVAFMPVRATSPCSPAEIFEEASCLQRT